MACWIIHQPEEHGGIVANLKGEQLLFRTEAEAMGFAFGNRLFDQGHVVQQVDASGFIAASDGDGCGSAWYDEAEIAAAAERIMG